MLLAAEKQNIINIFGDCKKLKRVAVGEKCSFIERNSFPEATQAKHPGQWYSQTDHVWYDLSQIAGRSGIADTYTNSETLG
jgi:hypothetical protein